MRYILLLLSFLFCIILPLTSCMMSRENCLSADWEEIGAQDGRNGEPLDRLERHKKSCSYYDIAANAVAYRLGRERGLQSYCMIQRQVDNGVKGTAYREVCDGEIVPILREANEWGLRYYNIEISISRTRSQLSDVRSQLDKEGIKKEEKSRLRDERDRLIDEIHRHKEELARVKASGERFLNQRLRQSHFGTR